MGKLLVSDVHVNNTDTTHFRHIQLSKLARQVQALRSAPANTTCHCLLQRAEHIILRRCSSSLLQCIRCCACNGSRVRGNCELTYTCIIVQHTQVAIVTQIVNKYQGNIGNELDLLPDLIR